GGVGDGIIFHSLKRTLPVNDPDVVARIDGHADHITHDPMIGQRLRPHGVDFKSRRLRAGGFHGRAFLENYRSHPERDNQPQQKRSDRNFTLHALLLHSSGSLTSLRSRRAEPYEDLPARPGTQSAVM